MTDAKRPDRPEFDAADMQAVRDRLDDLCVAIGALTRIDCPLFKKHHDQITNCLMVMDAVLREMAQAVQHHAEGQPRVESVTGMDLASLTPHPRTQ